MSEGSIYKKVSYEQYLNEALNGKRLKKECSSRDDEASYVQWAGGRWEEASRYARDGWPEGRELVGQIVKDIDAAGDVTLPVCVWDVTGDFVDIGAYVNGEPECMVRWENQPVQKRVARILYNITVSAGVSKEMMRWKGACVLGLVDRLQASGIRVQVDMAYCCSNYNRGTYTCVVTLKRPEEPLHLDLMAFHIVCPMSFRRLFFSYVEGEPESVRQQFGFKSSYGYGSPHRIDGLIPEEDKYDLIVPEIKLTDVESAKAKIEQMFDTVCNAKLLHESE